MKINWNEWRGDLEGRVVMRVKHLLRCRGRRVDLHKFIDADAPGCFHTHPAPAIRVILWGGYVEELEDGTCRTWKPGMVGAVRPDLSHRVARLLDARGSYSLWIRGRKSHEVELRGSGWDQPPRWTREDDGTFLTLLLVGGHDVPREAIADWTDAECQAAEDWAYAVHLHASDNDDVYVPPMPACVQAFATQADRSAA